ncbi:response regulator transcription factor [Pseudoalteromonas luteoviolacea]|uniref:Transcriptional regulator n=1 Tax=Pseudoalteromonas luteoviolacea S4060-1 TaxID=1365257 RepID=A0A167JLW7_9GAMM|nr:response regulator transcription factor [Pseudoalteromonas luteoviolacea]KZN61329.1 hypothetical protein N478_04495 [Pseudoalteromonas luteoviolacea S4060-1]
MGDRVLIIDDDVELSKQMAKYLSKFGYKVFTHNSGSNVESQISKYNPNLIILDLILPEVNGLNICKEIRGDFIGPIIMLTALNDEIDEITGLEIGADDYLCKPIKPRVLLAHIRAQLRRTPQASIVKSGCFEVINNLDETIVVNGKRVYLTSAEFELYSILFEYRGTIVSRNFLYEKIYGLEYDGFDRSIDLRVSRLRKKFSEHELYNLNIKSIRNIGYLLT